SIGLLTQQIIVVLAGSAIVGVGEGLGYRTGMRIVTGGLAPVAQGARNSVYSCLAYGTSAILVLGSGWVIAQLGFGRGSLAFALLAVPIAITYLIAVERDFRRGAERRRAAVAR